MEDNQSACETCTVARCVGNSHIGIMDEDEKCPLIEGDSATRTVWEDRNMTIPYKIGSIRPVGMTTEEEVTWLRARIGVLEEKQGSIDEQIKRMGQNIIGLYLNSIYLGHR